MPKRPFLVLPGGDCVPLEGDWRVEELRGEWYVLGHHSVIRCASEPAARRRFDDLSEQTDIDRLAEEAIATLESATPIEDGLAAELLAEIEGGSRTA